MKTRKIIRTYPSICTSCVGVGQIQNPNFNPNVTGDMMVMMCPTCFGLKQITISETFEEQIPE